MSTFPIRPYDVDLDFTYTFYAYDLYLMGRVSNLDKNTEHPDRILCFFFYLRRANMVTKLATANSHLILCNPLQIISLNEKVK